MPALAVFHSTVRLEEKLILEAARAKGVEVRLRDIRGEVLDPRRFPLDFDVALERSVSTVKGDYLIAFLEALGAPVVNTAAVARACGDKFRTSLLLERAGVPTPRFALAFGPEQAREAVARVGGYPVVVKPPLGSWGRLLAKINDDDALDAVLEHKEVLGTPPQKAFYVQEYVRKPGRDIRAFVFGREARCAIARESAHWITNTARGGAARNYPLTPELEDLCARTAEAVGEGLLAIDLFETPAGLAVNEVNHTMEFKNSETPTGYPIATAVVDYALGRARGRA